MPRSTFPGVLAALGVIMVAGSPALARAQSAWGRAAAPVTTAAHGTPTPGTPAKDRAREPAATAGGSLRAGVPYVALSGLSLQATSAMVGAATASVGAFDASNGGPAVLSWRLGQAVPCPDLQLAAGAVLVARCRLTSGQHGRLAVTLRDDLGHGVTRRIDLADAQRTRARPQ